MLLLHKIYIASFAEAYTVCLMTNVALFQTESFCH